MKKVGFFFHIYDEEGGRAGGTLSIRLNCLRKEISIAPEVIKPGFPTFFHATSAK